LRKIAILGGGMAGLTAAWELSADPDLKITVYQRGWRLGGKGASSRGAHGRIEEHGLHVWLGYYDNAFALVREVYAELDRLHTDVDCPVQTWREALAPAHRVGVQVGCGDSWAPWVATFSGNDLEPGTAPVGAGPLSVATFVQRGLQLLVDFARSLTLEPARVVLSGSPQRPRSPGGAGGLLRQAELALTVAIAEAARLFGDAVARTPAPLAPILLDVLDQVREAFVPRIRRDAAGRRTAELADLVLSCLTGAVWDGLLTSPDGFSTIDDLDFIEWLAKHGAAPETLASPLVRGMYDLVFAYQDGDRSRPRFAAGLGLFLAGKLFFEYRGAIFWQLQAGMGDVVIAPLYQALHARGVQFEFFHRLDGLHLDTGCERIAAITLGRQARTVADRAYQPLVRVGGLPCFPSRPLAEQLTGPVPEDLESHWSDRDREEPVRLIAGVDFDDVVLATSMGMLPHVAGELIEHSVRWRTMCHAVATVPTQALQLWLRADERELGWAHPSATVSGYVPPFDTYAAMSHLAEREDWPSDDRPRSVGFFCSVLPSAAAGDPAAADATVRANAAAFLDGPARRFWPGFRWSLLWSENGPCDDPTALDAQYWRANVDPSDRYVQSLPGSGRCRLRADRSGFSNLVLAGDWIDCGLNAGCVEAAVLAGRQAANAVRGRPLLTGLRGAWMPLRAT
jgi:uncharacterized protein with NAD-binding domain and iron-sulfur cluster